MKISKFFRVLNYKIAKYDKIVANPFTIPRPIVLIWIEEFKDIESENNKKF